MFKIVFICAAAAALLILALCWWLFRFIFYSPIPRRENPYSFPKGEQYAQARERLTTLIKDFDALPFETVTLTSHDGLKLYGRYYHVRDGAPVQIQFHGYHGTALRDFCGGNRLARDAGQNSLVIDERAHGKSEGHVISFGINERLVCLGWINYAAERFGPETPIIISGVSMGAATVLMAAELELPENVRCIVADCPYSSPEAIIRKVCGDLHMCDRLFFPFIRLAARLFGGFSLCSASALESVKHSKVPILLIHGLADSFVPCDMSRSLAKACASPVRLETFPGADHAMSYVADEARYERILQEFFSSCGL